MSDSVPTENDSNIKKKEFAKKKKKKKKNLVFLFCADRVLILPF